MLSEPTLIIVGAGASFELGLPTGLTLKDQVANRLNITFPNGYSQKSGDDEIAELLKRRAVSAGKQGWNHLLHKCWRIRDALPGALSIDNVLDAHNADPDLIYAGKLAIVKSILEGERKSKLFGNGSQYGTNVFQKAVGTWLIPFFQLLTENVRKDDVEKIFDNLHVISFNYDRSIERFLPEALGLYYGLDQPTSEQLASRLKIIHPYGSVGSLFRHGEIFSSYGDDQARIDLLADHIRTFSEGLANVELKASIQKAYSAASQLIFLGFAFHPINMQLLQADGPTAARKIFATTFGFGQPAQNVAEGLVLQTLNKSDYTDAMLLRREESAYADEVNFEPVTAFEMLNSHFRSIASTTL